MVRPPGAIAMQVRWLLAHSKEVLAILNICLCNFTAALVRDLGIKSKTKYAIYSSRIRRKIIPNDAHSER